MHNVQNILKNTLPVNHVSKTLLRKCDFNMQTVQLYSSSLLTINCILGNCLCLCVSHPRTLQDFLAYDTTHFAFFVVGRMGGRDGEERRAGGGRGGVTRLFSSLFSLSLASSSLPPSSFCFLGEGKKGGELQQKQLGSFGCCPLLPVSILSPLPSQLLLQKRRKKKGGGSVTVCVAFLLTHSPHSLGLSCNLQTAEIYCM